MKLLRLTTAYDVYLSYFYSRRPYLQHASYDVHQNELNADAFGWADFWAHALAPLGWQVLDITANARPLQTAWARENQFTYDDQHWLLEIAFEQVRQFKPDVLFMDDYLNFPAAWLRRLREDCSSIKLVMGWCGAPYEDEEVFRAYDVVLSNIPELVEHFCARGHTAYHLNHAFDVRLASRIEKSARDIEFSFAGTVGSLAHAHTQRFELLAALAKETPLQIYSPDGWDWPKRIRRARLIAFLLMHSMGIPVHKLPVVRTRVTARQLPSLADILKTPQSAIPGMRPAVFGMEMFGLLARSQLTLNSHTDISPRSASNMRLYEATGMGACLVTDWKSNIGELFEPDVEVVTYRTAGECVEKVKWLLTHPQERTRIAEAGRRRTLAAHTFDHRAPLLDQIIRRHI